MIVLTDLSELHEYPRIRLVFKNTDRSVVNEIEKDLKKKYHIQEISTSGVVDTNDVTSNKSAIGDVRKVEYQNELIKKYLTDHHPVDDDMISTVCDINVDINSGITISDQIKNVIWKPKRFEFSNMFSFGSDNTIDFSTMKEIYGLFGDNHTGKSSLPDALSYCIFDKCSRTSLASEVLNNKQSEFTSKFIDPNPLFVDFVGAALNRK